MSKFIILFIFGISIAAFADDYRSFTDKDDRIVRAKILKVDTQRKTVTIERENKRKFTVPIHIFSETDQAYILSWTPTTKPTKHDSEPVFRDAFTLKLPLDKKHYYEQNYPKVPYVHNNEVCIFPNEEFRVGIIFSKGKVQSVTYDPNKKCDQYFEFIFKHKFTDSGEVHMTLTATNKTKYNMIYDAIMVVPDNQSPLKTSIVPVYAGLMSFEFWPHPILQLLLGDFRIVEKKK